MCSVKVEEPHVAIVAQSVPLIFDCKKLETQTSMIKDFTCQLVQQELKMRTQ